MATNSNGDASLDRTSYFFDPEKKDWRKIYEVLYPYTLQIHHETGMVKLSQYIVSTMEPVAVEASDSHHFFEGLVGDQQRFIAAPIGHYTIGPNQLFWKQE